VVAAQHEQIIDAIAAKDRALRCARRPSTAGTATWPPGTRSAGPFRWRCARALPAKLCVTRPAGALWPRRPGVGEEAIYQLDGPPK
jgi:hypothetical protein